MHAVNGTKIIKFLLTDSDPKKGRRLRLLPVSENISRLIGDSDFLP